MVIPLGTQIKTIRLENSDKAVKESKKKITCRTYNSPYYLQTFKIKDLKGQIGEINKKMKMQEEEHK